MGTIGFGQLFDLLFEVLAGLEGFIRLSAPHGLRTAFRRALNPKLIRSSGFRAGDFSVYAGRLGGRYSTLPRDLNPNHLMGYSQNYGPYSVIDSIAAPNI